MTASPKTSSHLDLTERTEIRIRIRNLENFKLELNISGDEILGSGEGRDFPDLNPILSDFNSLSPESLLCLKGTKIPWTMSEGGDLSGPGIASYRHSLREGERGGLKKAIKTHFITPTYPYSTAMQLDRKIYG